MRPPADTGKSDPTRRQCDQWDGEKRRHARCIPPTLTGKRASSVAVPLPALIDSRNTCRPVAAPLPIHIVVNALAGKCHAECLKPPSNAAFRRTFGDAENLCDLSIAMSVEVGKK